MGSHKTLDPREKPPLIIRETYKSHQKLRYVDGDADGTLLDLKDERVHEIGVISGETILKACLAIEDYTLSDEMREDLREISTERPIYEHADLPGLLIVPSLLPPRTQKALLSRLLHRDLSNPEHLTNVHFHHKLPYPENQQSFFSLPRDGPQIEPLDSSLHKCIPLESFLTKKLRWATLGGQYDWTAKVYPTGPTPTFPPDITKFLETLFPAMKAEAAILNLYSPGDVLSMHRDVAEESDKGLISISIGCDAVFVIGLGQDHTDETSNGTVPDDVEPRSPLVIRLRSGDAVFMGGKSRFAWHGVPKIIPNTCPDHLKDWPASEEDKSCDYKQWKGWMTNKRINLNVRQMWD